MVISVSPSYATVSYVSASLDIPQWHVKQEGRMERRLNPTAASLLGFLHDGPRSGYELVAAAQHRIGDFWSLTQSQVYRELSWMAEAGLVTAGERGTRERRPRTARDRP